MVREDKLHWELLNNEVRRVVRDNADGSVTLITRFRTISNELIFTNVYWAEKLELLAGEVINYVQDVAPDSVTAEMSERLKTEYSPDFTPNDIANGSKRLYRLVCNRNQSEFFLIAGNMNIRING